MTVSADDANEFAEVLEAAHQWLLAGMVANDPPPVAMIIEACGLLADWTDNMPSEPRRLIEEMSADLGVPGPHNRSYAAGVRCLRAILAELQRRYLTKPRHR
jgi:hypothetical protein